MNTNEQLVKINAKELNRFLGYHGLPVLTNAEPFLLGKKVHISGATDHVDVDERGNHVYKVKVSSELFTADYSIIVTEHNSTLNAIKESSLIKCNYENSDTEIKEAAHQLLKEFMIAVAGVVMKHLGYDSIFDLSETELPQELNPTSPTTQWYFLED